MLRDDWLLLYANTCGFNKSRQGSYSLRTGVGVKGNLYIFHCEEVHVWLSTGNLRYTYQVKSLLKQCYVGD